MKFTEQTFNILTLIGGIVMAIVVFADLIIPKPVNKLSEHDKRQNLHSLEVQAAAQKQQLDQANKTVARYVWNAKHDDISSQSLKTVTALALKHRVQLLGFRPAKGQEANGLTQNPYLVLLSGAFPDVESLLVDLESPVNKLAINMVQYSSADSNTDQVNATVSVFAYTLSQEAANAGTATKQP